MGAYVGYFFLNETTIIKKKKKFLRHQFTERVIPEYIHPDKKMKNI